MENNQILPNSTTVLVLGILSITLCFCYGIPGLVLGIIAIVLANKSNKLYLKNPTNYSESSLNNLKAGKTCAIIGLSLSSLFVICILIYVSLVGVIFTALPWAEMMNQY